jgi:predicted ATPase
MQAPGMAIVEGLAAELRGQTCLMVLDNCEHLVDSLAQVVERLLETAAGVTVLATSREPLGVPGEVIWRVPSLDTPPARGHAQRAGRVAM